MTVDYSARLSVAERSALGDALARGLKDACAAIRLDQAAMARITLMLQDGSFGVQGTIGFLQGFQEGFLAGASVWEEELTAYLKILGLGLKVGAAEFFYRPIVEDHEPTGLSPQVRSELETLRSLRLMGPVLQWLDAVGPLETIDLLREIVPTAEDIAIILGRAATQWATTWLAELVATAPDAVAAGRHIGKLIGRVALEVLRACLEPDQVSVALTAAGVVSEMEKLP